MKRLRYDHKAVPW